MTITSLFSLSFPDFCQPATYATVPCMGQGGERMFFFSSLSHVYHAKYCTCVCYRVLSQALSLPSYVVHSKIPKIRWIEHVLNHTRRNCGRHFWSYPSLEKKKLIQAIPNLESKWGLRYNIWRDSVWDQESYLLPKDSRVKTASKNNWWWSFGTDDVVVAAPCQMMEVMVMVIVCLHHAFSLAYDLLYFHVAVCLHNGIIFDRTGERGRKREREIEM